MGIACACCLRLAAAAHAAGASSLPLPAGFNNNRLSGALPASFTFNSSYKPRGLSVAGNNFSGAVPSWPDQPGSLLEIRPGNEGLCGEVRCWLCGWFNCQAALAAPVPGHPLHCQALVLQVPESPMLVGEPGTDAIQSLPPCPGAGANSSDDGGLSGGAIAGIVVGSVAGAARE